MRRRQCTFLAKTRIHGLKEKTVFSIRGRRVWCKPNLVTIHSSVHFCELARCLRDYNLTKHQGSNLVEICQLEIDDQAFLMAMKDQGDPLTVKPQTTDRVCLFSVFMGYRESLGTSLCPGPIFIFDICLCLCILP